MRMDPFPFHFSSSFIKSPFRSISISFIISSILSSFLLFVPVFPSSREFGQTGEDDLKGRQVNKSRAELDHRKVSIARVKGNADKREYNSARTRALRWFRVHAQYRVMQIISIPIISIQVTKLFEISGSTNNESF